MKITHSILRNHRWLWIVAVVVIVWLVVLDFVPSGRLEVAYGFEKASPFISRLSPDGRVLPFEQNEAGEYYQHMVIEPVYFDVRLPQEFERARANVWYKKNATVPFRIGFRTLGGEWSWHIEEVIPVEQQGSWTLGEVVFRLEGADYRERHLRFIVASPGLSDHEEKIELHRIEIVFEKERLRRDNALRRLKEYVRSWI